jgi:glycosyltransferase involved in cell wall biosynthesis
LTVPLLPKLNKQYDAAIGFLWPHYFIGEKVDAKQKIGWIHTDYANIAINQKMESQMWEKLDHIVAVSDDCLENFLKGYPACKNKGLVIENMLSPNMIREQARKEIPEEIRKVPGRTILVTVGRFTHAKGLDLAVKACRRLIDDGFDIAWYVAGYGPLENMLRRLIAECGLQERFILLGKKVNPYPYIHACDVYVQPSRYEGNAVTVREAQILQKPVVLTGFPTAKSQAQNGYDALITPLSVHGIAEGIKRMIAEEHLRERLISNLQNNDYGNEAEVNKLYQLIDNR